VAASLYTDDGRHTWNVISRNVGDEINVTGGGAIPGRIPTNNTGANSLDQAATTPLGRTVTLQYKFAF